MRLVLRLFGIIAFLLSQSIVTKIPCGAFSSSEIESETSRCKRHGKCGTESPRGTVNLTTTKLNE